jgi:hypothetical protein
VVTSTTDDPVFVGKWCYFIVVDNGEGSKDQVDQMSDVYPWLEAPVDCADIPDNTELLHIDRGNIRVKL